MESHRRRRAVTLALTIVGTLVGIAAALVPPTALAGQANPPMKVNPYWAQARQLSFGGVQWGDVRAFSNDAGKTPDGGIVVARLFIPASRAAGGQLIGDGRGFDGDPYASSRGVLAWDVGSGRVSITVNHSMVWAQKYTHPAAALPLVQLPYSGNFHQDVKRDVNEFGLRSNPKGNSVDARLSLLNPATNQGVVWWSDFGAWSVDYKIAINRVGPDNYRIAHLEGNGYPAIEAYYYPHFIRANSAPQAWVIGKRRVAPIFTGLWIDGGGGLAAVDHLSWNLCSYVGSGNDISCRNTAPYANAQTWQPWQPWREMWGALPSEAEWKAPWMTRASASAAM